MKKQIAIYNENHSSRGSRCWHAFDMGEELAEQCGDLIVYSAETAEEWTEIKELAETYLNRPVRGGHDAFLNKVGRELMDWYELEGPVA